MQRPSERVDEKEHGTSSTHPIPDDAESIIMTVAEFKAALAGATRPEDSASEVSVGRVVIKKMMVTITPAGAAAATPVPQRLKRARQGSAGAKDSFRGPLAHGLRRSKPSQAEPPARDRPVSSPCESCGTACVYKNELLASCLSLHGENKK